jgi:pilus assembly protein CpaE
MAQGWTIDPIPGAPPLTVAPVAPGPPTGDGRCELFEEIGGAPVQGTLPARKRYLPSYASGRGVGVLDRKTPAASPDSRPVRSPGEPPSRSVEAITAEAGFVPDSPGSLGPILLLVDEGADAALLDRALGGGSCTSLAPTDVEEACALVSGDCARLVIVDASGPDGPLDLVRRLREAVGSGRVPLLVITTDQSVEARIAALEAGADDVLTRPFAEEELLARAETLVRRSERSDPGAAVAAVDTPRLGAARMIAVHSLRGGVGATSLAVNLAIALRNLWGAQVLLLDLVPTAGQAGFYLNAVSPRSWAQLVERASHLREEFDWVTIHHDSGIDLIASPEHEPPELLDPEGFLDEVFAGAIERYDYVVVDLPHDLGPAAMRTLDLADIVVAPVAPDLASVRAASIALAAYRERGFQPEKIRIVLNTTIGRGSVPTADVEKGLRERVELVLPYAPDVFLASINQGRPVARDRGQQIAGLVEGLAYRISLTRHLLAEESIPLATGRVRDRQEGRGGRRGWSLPGRGGRS